MLNISLLMLLMLLFISDGSCDYGLFAVAFATFIVAFAIAVTMHTSSEGGQGVGSNPL